ncbi:hypothetical protein NrS5_28 [Nitratiruptor phage NrS-5]|uniref:hypothetical protein n=1 Tax=unclassified Nitratiruptor TaxID=2624044 RepID=UPI0019162529|nr:MULTISPECIES: hypothetical protein [unclassified Nitratiruptor]BCD61732.1 hypothetical protein NitYY0813_C0592 [Nitratiruptor sp. YY08-13]BCD65667.1 hypothetical protein NitYY0826_C0594 [Nitratiruptor sp. YY08-26]BCD83210.1 hypothetical protein NrS4_28 [Nitratiruptor phage NrS-4]BCD83269.1 hypothetical protein NrS5_28 [Nitratiruptor phage NrS-5]
MNKVKKDLKAFLDENFEISAFADGDRLARAVAVIDFLMNKRIVHCTDIFYHLLGRVGLFTKREKISACWMRRKYLELEQEYAGFYIAKYSGIIEGIVCPYFNKKYSQKKFDCKNFREFYKEYIQFAIEIREIAIDRIREFKYTKKLSNKAYEIQLDPFRDHLDEYCIKEGISMYGVSR